nr:hypothetical protein Itr_chr13CG06410 [Ipomoea trifida]
MRLLVPLPTIRMLGQQLSQPSGECKRQSRRLRILGIERGALAERFTSLRVEIHPHFRRQGRFHNYPETGGPVNNFTTENLRTELGLGFSRSCRRRAWGDDELITTFVQLNLQSLQTSPAGSSLPQTAFAAGARLRRLFNHRQRRIKLIDIHSPAANILIVTVFVVNNFSGRSSRAIPARAAASGGGDGGRG